jgi:tetratricopeptide (TPR) repeat protein
MTDKNTHITEEEAIAYVDNALSLYEKFKLQEHTRICPECSRILQNWQNFHTSQRRILSTADREKIRQDKVKYLYLDDMTEAVIANRARQYRIGFLVEGGPYYQDQYLSGLREMIQDSDIPTIQQYADMLNSVLVPTSRNSDVLLINNSAEIGNLTELASSGHSPVILSSNPQAWGNVRSDVLPQREYSVPLSDDEREELRKQAGKCYIALSDEPEIWEPLSWIFLFGAFWLLTPVSILELVTGIAGDSLKDRLQKAMPVLMTIPDHSGGDGMDYITAKSDRTATGVLKIMGLWATESLSDKISAALGLILSSEGKLSSDECLEFSFRLLNSLVLSSRRKVALNAMRHHNDKLQALQEKVTDVRHIHAWANVYRKLDHPYGHARARQFYELGLSKESDNIYLMNSYASFLTDQREYFAAERLFRKIEGLSQNIYTYTAWADMRIKWGRHLDEARDMLKKASEMEPDNPYPLQMLGQLEQRKVYFEPLKKAEDFQRGLEQAEASFKRALEVDEDNVPSIHALGHLARERGHLNDSEKWLNKVLEIEPDSIYAMVELGRIYTEKLKEAFDEVDRKAAQRFHQAIELEEDNIRVHTAWADLDIKARRFDEAEERLRTAERIAIERNESTAVIATTRVKLDLKREQLGESKIKSIINLLDRLRVNPDPNVQLVARNLLVKVFWITGDKNLAEGMFYDAFDHNPIPRVINNFASLLSGEAKKSKNIELFVKADNWYKEALSRDRENAYTNKGYGLNLLNWSEVEPNDTRQRTGLEAISKARDYGVDTPEVT